MVGFPDAAVENLGSWDRPPQCRRTPMSCPKRVVGRRVPVGTWQPPVAMPGCLPFDILPEVAVQILLREMSA